MSLKRINEFMIDQAFTGKVNNHTEELHNHATKLNEVDSKLADVNTKKADKTYVESSISTITEQLAEKASQSDLATTNTVVALKRDKTEKIKGTDLDTSADASKVKLINLADEVQQALTGNAPALSVIENEGVTQEKIAPKGVDFQKHTKQIPLVFRTKPRNLFDKNAITSGNYVVWSTGALSANSGYVASDYIPIEGGVNYSISHQNQATWYDVNKVYISGHNAGTDDAVTLLAPVNAKYLRISVRNANVDKMMVEQSDTLGKYEPYFTELKIAAKEYLKEESITRNELDLKSVTPSKLSFIPVFGQKGKNLFNKDEVYLNKNISTINGSLIDFAGVFTSEFIEVDPNAQYTLTKNETDSFVIATYDGDKKFISSFTTLTITTPSTANFVRFRTTVANLDICQFEKGSLSTSYEPYGSYLSENNFLPNTIPLNAFKGKIIQNPADIMREYLLSGKAFKVKLMGDSITHGSGGTGRADNGDTIPGTTQKMNPDGYCWANSLRDLLGNKFGERYHLKFDNPRIEKLTTNRFDNSDNYQFKNDIVGEELISFDFTGEELKIIYISMVSGGIVEVLIDGVIHSTIDAYSATTVRGNEYVVALEKGTHNLKLRATHTKNASSTNYLFSFQGLKYSDKAIVVNYAQPGTNSRIMHEQRETLIEDDDDVLIMQIGTNDRSNLKSPEETKNYQREIIKTAYSKGIKVILMSAPPAAVVSDHSDNNPIRNFGMFDVDKAMRELAYEFNMTHISNYDAFLEFAENRNISIETLLADGLHPNDAGYDVMFRNIVRNLGMSYIQSGVNKVVYY